MDRWPRSSTATTPSSTATARPTRTANNNVAIDSAWVAPRTFSAFGGYGATFTFSGGDIRDYGATPTTMSITGSGSNGFIFARPFSFTGPVTISGSGAVFGFQPTVAGRLTQTLQLGGSSGSVSLRGTTPTPIGAAPPLT